MYVIKEGQGSSQDPYLIKYNKLFVFQEHRLLHHTSTTCSCCSCVLAGASTTWSACCSRWSFSSVWPCCSLAPTTPTSLLSSSPVTASSPRAPASSSTWSSVTLSTRTRWFTSGQVPWRHWWSARRRCCPSLARRSRRWSAPGYWHSTLVSHVYSLMRLSRLPHLLVQNSHLPSNFIYQNYILYFSKLKIKSQVFFIKK